MISVFRSISKSLKIINSATQSQKDDYLKELLNILGITSSKPEEKPSELMTKILRFKKK